MLNRTSLLLVPLLVLGCHHQKNEAQNATAQQTASQAGPSQAATTTGGPSCRQDLDCGAKQLCVSGRCVDITPNLAECTAVRVHFDFDSSEMHAGDRPELERVARCLKADRAMHVTIEGNADERGTQEYNLALGDRRATTVAKYLEVLGVSDVQLKTVSYGKEQPLCTEHDETCWSKNRRANLKPKEARR